MAKVARLFRVTVSVNETRMTGDIAEKITKILIDGGITVLDVKFQPVGRAPQRVCDMVEDRR